MISKPAIKYGSILLYILLSYSIFIIFSKDIVYRLAHYDDSLIENLGTLYLFFASAIFLFLFSKDRKGNDFIFFKSKKNIFYLLLGILFFFAAGEEISWGQRIFDWQTSDWFGQYNSQKETNLHNLVFFSANKLFTLFWLLYCIIVPILNKVSSIIADFFQRINLPIVPIWLSVFFLISYVASYSFTHIYEEKGYGHAIVEVKETTAYFLFFIFSIYVLLESKSINKN